MSSSDRLCSLPSPSFEICRVLNKVNDRSDPPFIPQNPAKSKIPTPAFVTPWRRFDLRHGVTENPAPWRGVVFYKVTKSNLLHQRRCGERSHGLGNTMEKRSKNGSFAPALWGVGGSKSPWSSHFDRLLKSTSSSGAGAIFLSLTFLFPIQYIMYRRKQYLTVSLYFCNS